MKRAIGISIAILLVCSCTSYEKRYSNISKEVNVSLANRDKSSVIKVVDDIGEKEILSKQGVQFLKLKVMGLTYCGEFERAYSIMDEYIEKYFNYPEIVLAVGVLAEIVNRDGNPYFIEVLNYLDNQIVIGKSDNLKVLYIYTLCIMQEPKENIKKSPLYSSLPAIDREIADYYINMSRKELLFSSPVGFISSPILDTSRNLQDKKWW